MSNATLSRRAFLTQSAAALATVTVRRAPQRVIIIGAGLAGLVAAYEMNQAGHNVTVLEARLWPGGRVMTLREPFSDGLYAEAGALFVPNHHTDTMKWIRRFGLPMETILPRGASELYFVKGRRIILKEAGKTNWPLELTAEELEAGLGGLWDRYLGSIVKQMGDVASANWPPESLAWLDKLSFYDLLRKQGASPDAISLMRLGYLDLWGDGIESLSALAVMRDLTLRMAEQETYAIKGGNDQLPRAFASRLKSNIRYGAAVTKIVQESGLVRATYKQNDEEKTVDGDRLLCAIPFSTLRHIEVTPQFSPAKRKAIEELPYTSVARVFLQTSRRVWTDQGLPGIANTDLPVMWLWEPTVNQPGKRGIIESYSAGLQARKITAMKEPERLQFTLDHMEKVYPGLKGAFEKGIAKCWDDDRWSRGDYAWFKPGQVTGLLPHIAKPEGRIHFAGEHASAHPGWMQGALKSGSRAAREIMEAAT